VSLNQPDFAMRLLVEKKAVHPSMPPPFSRRFALGNAGDFRRWEALVKQPPSFDDGRPRFDHSLASELIGKHVLVGVTRVDADGKLMSQKQFHGEVVKADSKKGFCIKLLGTRDGELEWLPPDTRAFFQAQPGEYRLRTTGEVIVDPDYTTTWTITEPKKKAP
jgi:hypothetical protein